MGTGASIGTSGQRAEGTLGRMEVGCQALISHGGTVHSPPGLVSI